MTLPEYLHAREGFMWTDQNTDFVLRHVAEIERTYTEMLRVTVQVLEPEHKEISCT